MGIIKVPYSRKVHNRITWVCILLLHTSIALFVWSLAIRYWTGILTAGPAVVGLWYYLRLIERRTYFQTKEEYITKAIKEINDKGFVVVQDENQIKLLWRNIDYIELIDDNSVDINLKTHEVLNLDNSYLYWYLFLQVIPKLKLKSDKIPDFINKLFEEIETCPVCGGMKTNSTIA